MKHLPKTSAVLKALEARNATSYVLMKGVLKSFLKALVDDLKGPVAARGYAITTEDTEFDEDYINLAIDLVKKGRDSDVEHQLSFDFSFEDGVLVGGQASILHIDGITYFSEETEDADEVLGIVRKCLKHFDENGFKEPASF